jgi:hypothetical protein
MNNDFLELLKRNDKDEIKDYLMRNGKKAKVISPIIFINNNDNNNEDDTK